VSSDHFHHFFVASPHRGLQSDIISRNALTSSCHSTNSIDEILNGEDVHISEEQWKSELSVRVEQITNLKRSTTEGRTESFAAYAHILMARYANEEIEPHIRDLLQSMLRSVRQETTEREAVKALKGTSLGRLLHTNLLIP
jgi:hypothetical protein